MMMMIIIIIIIIFLRRTYYASTGPVYVQFISYNLKVHIIAMFVIVEL